MIPPASARIRVGVTASPELGAPSTATIAGAVAIAPSVTGTAPMTRARRSSALRYPTQRVEIAPVG